MHVPLIVGKYIYYVHCTSYIMLSVTNINQGSAYPTDLDWFPLPLEVEDPCCCALPVGGSSFDTPPSPLFPDTADDDEKVRAW